jgi:trans-AT polyketide synthase/acyltransferase/oxidoreductase domain-containing protein
MLAVVFPGQGSQKRGMGAELFDAFPELVSEADDVLGWSLRELCVDDPASRLNRTEYTQPAVFVVNALSFLARQRRGSEKPDFLLGHSLGEFNALWVAGCFDFATGVRLVKRRGELMGRAKGGGMAAVVGIDVATARALLRDSSLSEIDVANLNTPQQHVLAGPLEALTRAAPVFEARGATFIPLPVSAPFHSRYMEPVRHEFEAFLQGFELEDPQIPVIANATAQPYQPGEVKVLLGRQLRDSVRWCDSVRLVMSVEGARFEEVGHGTILARMIASIQGEASPIAFRRALPAGSNALHPGGHGGIAAEPSNAGAMAPGVSPATARAQPALVMQRAAPPLPPAHAATVVRSGPVLERAQSTLQRAQPAPALQRRESGFFERGHASPGAALRVRAEALGSRAFREEYGVRLAYVAGSMYRGIASEALVTRMARAGLLSFFGTAGLPVARVREAIATLRAALPNREAFGMNLLSTASESALVDLYLELGVDLVEASAYVQLSDPIVRYRALGVKRRPDGQLVASNRVIAKVSRVEIAESFLRPPPEASLRRLVETKQIDAEQALLAAQLPMADDLCVEADSGGHTDGGALIVLLPRMLGLRDRIARELGLARGVRVGAAGGIGTSDAVLAAFLLGADFVLTGSINQCSVQAAQSEVVKDMLQAMDVHDTDYAPAGDMFELGARVQVLKRGVFFPARANRLLDLYRNFSSLDAIDEMVRTQLEKNYFHRSCEQVFEEVKRYRTPQDIERAERDPRVKMAMVFKWYFAHTSDLAVRGVVEHKVNFQVHCGPCLGAFNNSVRGTALEDWRARNVDELAEHLMHGAAALLDERLSRFSAQADARTGVGGAIALPA